MVKKYVGPDTIKDVFRLLLNIISDKQNKVAGTAENVLGFNDAGEAAPLTIQAGKNMTITRTGNVLTISAVGSESSGRVFTIKADTSDSNGGSVSGGGMFCEGESVTLVAMHNEGYAFYEWTENGTRVSTDSAYTFTVTGNRTLTANFVTSTTWS